MFSVGATLTSCYDDNNISPLWAVVSDHEQRLSDLEEWQDQVNQNIESLQRLLNTTDYITSVTPLMEGGEEVGYTITFLNSDPINIYHGKKGEDGDKGADGEQGDDGHTPQIGLTQGTDGNWYWTLDGELMLDKDNNPIRANGEDGQQGQQGQQGQPGTSASTPQIKLGSTIDSGAIGTDNGVVQPTAWYLSVDGGQTWYRITGDKGEPGDEGDKGDAFFADNPKLSDDGTHYTFTLSDDDNTDLSDNPTFKVPVYHAFSLGTGMLELDPGTNEIEITLPAGTTADDYRALVAQITPEGADGTYTDIATRANDAGGWSVEAKFNNDNTATLTITAGTSINALLRVTLVKNDGSELAASRVLEAYQLKVCDYFYSDGTTSTKLQEGKTPVGIVCSTSPYDGTYTQGLVIALTNASESMAWDEAMDESTRNAYNATAPAPATSSGWMLIGSDQMAGIVNAQLDATIEAAGGTKLVPEPSQPECCYWSSTFITILNAPAYVTFRSSDDYEWGGAMGSNDRNKTYRVRYFLAF